ncbi:MAG: excinuclease ABC subunit UvrC, partial [Pseudohongiellaceae bacterium]
NQGSDADIIAAAIKPPYYCVHVLYVRSGRVVGSKNYYPKFKLLTDEPELISAFVGQHYLNQDTAGHSLSIPAELLISHALEDQDELAEGLSYCAARQIRLADKVRGYRAKWLKLAATNAQSSLESLISNRQNTQQRFDILNEVLKLERPIQRIECFDISHTSGESTVAACVVFDTEGPVKADYRRFNIKGTKAGDDYAAMQQALGRRFARLARGEGKIPDILLIDGGKGQLSQVLKALKPFDIPDLVVLGIAKGISRRVGQETLFLANPDETFNEIALVNESAALHLLQQVRDEAHRFAITGHRQRREKSRKTSTLEEIPGLGPKRRRELLRHFGGRQEIGRASESELAKVNGINRKLAELIYAHLH